MLGLLLTSAVIAAIISKRAIESTNELKYITGERQKWRNDIREGMIELRKLNNNQSNIFKDYLEAKSFFALRFNPYGDFENDFLSELEELEYPGKLSVLKELEKLNYLKKNLQFFLKNDWEKSKWEASSKLIYNLTKLSFFLVILAVNYNFILKDTLYIYSKYNLIYKDLFNQLLKMILADIFVVGIAKITIDSIRSRGYKKTCLKNWCIWIILAFFISLIDLKQLISLINLKNLTGLTNLINLKNLTLLKSLIILITLIILKEILLPYLGIFEKLEFMWKTSIEKNKKKFNITRLMNKIIRIIKKKVEETTLSKFFFVVVVISVFFWGIFSYNEARDGQNLKGVIMTIVILVIGVTIGQINSGYKLSANSVNKPYFKKKKEYKNEIIKLYIIIVTGLIQLMVLAAVENPTKVHITLFNIMLTAFGFRTINLLEYFKLDGRQKIRESIKKIK